MDSWRYSWSKVESLLVGLTPKDRGAKGLKESKDPVYLNKIIDAAYKLYQDRMDVICLCSVQMRKAIQTAVNTNLPIILNI